MPQRILEILKSEGRLRRIPEEGNRGRTDLLSNDYMGLAEKTADFIDEFRVMLDDSPEPISFSSSASRLLSRRQYWLRTLEDELMKFYGKPALLFNSGYHANTGCLSALSSLDSTLFLSDKLNHASAIDGLRLGKSEVKRFPHNDISKVETLLKRNAENFKRVIIVVEAIYSMDGDMSPIKELVNLKHLYPNVYIYLDEAHSFGVLGDMGLGLAEKEGLIDDIDFIVGTFGKAAASAGAFIVCREDWKNFFINSARSFIFSTALPPLNNAWSLLMFRKLRSMKEERLYLAEKCDRFRSGLEHITGCENPSRSQIVPFMTGDAIKAVEYAEQLQAQGFDVLPIRRPTVPPGGERIRISISASTPEPELNRLLGLLE